MKTPWANLNDKSTIKQRAKPEYMRSEHAIARYAVDTIGASAAGRRPETERPQEEKRNASPARIARGASKRKKETVGHLSMFIDPSCCVGSGGACMQKPPPKAKVDLGRTDCAIKPRGAPGAKKAHTVEKPPERPVDVDAFFDTLQQLPRPTTTRAEPTASRALHAWAAMRQRGHAAAPCGSAI